MTPGPALRVTAGGEVQRHFETDQTGQNDSGFYLSRNDPYSVLAGYLVGDVTPARALKLSVGSRLDYYSNFGSSLSPRAAVIVRPYEAGNLKVVVGKAFRAPSVYEHYYTGPTQIPGLTLRPERIVSGEVESRTASRAPSAPRWRPMPTTSRTSSSSTGRGPPRVPISTSTRQARSRPLAPRRRCAASGETAGWSAPRTPTSARTI